MTPPTPPIAGLDVGPTDRTNTLVAGKYRLRRPIGRGASGLVWEAEQEPFERRVAVKLCVASHQLEADDVARFRRGAIAAGRMSHPNIVTIHDFGEQLGPDGPELYLVMERLEGASLARFLKRGPLPPHRARAAVAQLLSALRQVHERGYVHRDVKPSNLLAVATDDTPFLVKLLDFGIARSVDSAEAVAETATTNLRRGTRVTQPMRILGTPDYMAPEQILDQALDPRTDLYAAGVVLWHLLVGEPPFSGSERRETYAAHLRTPIPDIGPLLPPAHIADPGPWRAFFERALAKSPADRFPDAHAMRAALRELPVLP